MAIKKLHLIEKKLPSDRNSLLLYFIRKILKEVLYRIRSGKAKGLTSDYGPIDIYCLSQLCYELINVEEEGQLLAFYQLLVQEGGGRVGQTEA